jgi:hypothetical protein
MREHHRFKNGSLDFMGRRRRRRTFTLAGRSGHFRGRSSRVRGLIAARLLADIVL